MNHLAVDILPVLNDNYIFILNDKVSGITAAVDPALGAPVLKHTQGKLDYIFITHHHQDHVGGIEDIKSKVDCQVVGFAGDRQRIPHLSIALADGDQFEFGSITFRLKWLPGHTTGHCCFYSSTENALFSGDTFFAMGCGRLFEGTPQQMLENFKWLRDLPARTRIYCTHEYTEANGEFAITVEPDNADLQKRMAEVKKARRKGEFTVPTTVGDEIATNPFARWDSPSIRGFFNTQTDVETFAAARKFKDNF